jgi:hypothetical protein
MLVIWFIEDHINKENQWEINVWLRTCIHSVASEVYNSGLYSDDSD